MKKRIIPVILVLLLAVSLAAPASALVDKSQSFYVADDAGVLSESMEKKIIASNAGLEKKCDGAQIVVVTVEYLDGMKSSEYAMTLFNNWGVGDKKANNGMLLLLATGENKAWLSVGAGISGSFSTKMVDTYFDKYFWKEFDKGHYETATSNMLEALFSWYADYYNVRGESESRFGSGNFGSGAAGTADKPGSSVMEYGGVILFLAVFAVFILVAITALIRKASRRPRRIRTGRPRVGDDTFDHTVSGIPGGNVSPGSASDPRNAAWLGAQLGTYYYLHHMTGDQHNANPDVDNAGDGFGGFGDNGPGDNSGFGSGFGAGMGDGGGGFSGGGGGRD